MDLQYKFKYQNVKEMNLPLEIIFLKISDAWLRMQA